MAKKPKPNKKPAQSKGPRSANDYPLGKFGGGKVKDGGKK